MTGHRTMTPGMRSACITGMFIVAPALFAQQPPATPPPATPPATGQAAEAPPPPPFTYSSEGRRDPFISLLGRGAQGRSATSRPAGLPGLLIDEVVVRGIIQDARGYYALVTGSDQKVILTVRAGDRLMDGTVKAVMPGEVVFSQEVNDPLLLQKQREIRKSLRPGEESRG
jgi:Tfp pilus assembly protein PilP